MPVNIFFDCGAPSLYNKLSRAAKNTHIMGTHLRNRRRDDFSYVKAPEYKTYFEGYIQFLLEQKAFLTCYSNLDVINNAELTWKNQKRMEKAGLSPLPVWHFGTDVAYLERYIAAGYPYICIGGMVPNPSAVLRPALDRIWSQTLCDKDGIPKVKIHGFAMTSFDLMYRYPWYSVDSKSWIDYARFGFILVPPYKRDGTLDWLHPARIGISNRAVEKRNPARHYRFMSAATRRLLHEYLKSINVDLGESILRKEPLGYELKDKEVWAEAPTKATPGIVEHITVKGVRTCHLCRMDTNVCLFKKIEEIVPAWPWSLHRTVTRTVTVGRQQGLFA